MTEDNNYKKSKEITGVIFLALSIFLFMCLLSYNSSDPSLTHYVAHKVTIHNFGGFVGSYISDSLLKIFGVSSYWFPVVFIIISFKFFLNKSFKINFFVPLGLLGLIFSTSALLSLKFQTSQTLEASFDLGGILGKYSSELMQSYLNHVGSFMALIVILLISLMLTINLSLVSVTGRLLKLGQHLTSCLTTFILIRKERFKRKKRIPKEKKSKNKKPIPSITEELSSKKTKHAKKIEQISFDFINSKDDFTLPPLSLLDNVERKDTKMKKESLIMNSRLLEKKLADFGVEAKVVEVKTGPVISMYELEPAPGVKINKITNLSDDLALALKAQSVRIVAPIPGKSAIGIEIPNNERNPVYLRDVLDNSEYAEVKFRLPVVLGKDIVGTPVITDLAKMPHLLIAGTTGSGKSVSLNAAICSILFKSKPGDVKFIMIDPKRLELSGYEGIPHLLHPVVVDPRKASQVLKWTVDEMEKRYKAIAESGAKNIDKYNALIEKGSIIKPASEDLMDSAQAPTKLPYIVLVIDELADLMMVAQRNVEESLARLAQMARAAGIHLILATQRPSVDVITGMIKANFPTRISFQVSSKVDSRTILDQLGAERLLGAGDMLFIPPGTSKLRRIHGAFVSDKEIERVSEFIKKQKGPQYDLSISEYNPDSKETKQSEEEYDEKYDEAIELVTDLGHASISLVQRYMKIGYNRAARIIEKMEKEGIVGPSDGAKPRKVLARKLP